MVLRQPSFVGFALLAAVALATTTLPDTRYRTRPLKAGSTCGAQLPSGAEPDVLDSRYFGDANYAVSVTPDGGTASWGQNTNGHQAVFTVTNTGLCNDTYDFSASGTGGITGISLNKTSQLVNAGQNTTVTVTYNVTTPGSATLTLQATGRTGGEGDNGYFNVTVILYAVAVTPDAQPIYVAAGTSQAVRLQVQNTGTSSNTYTLSCTASPNETCGTVIPTSLTLAAGTFDSATVNFTAGATGTSGTVTLTASGTGGATDNGSFSISNVTFSVAVTPDAKPRSVAAGMSQTLIFQVRNTGTVTDSYALTCTVTGNETCGPVSPATLANMAPGVTYVATLSVVSGSAGTSGTAGLHAARSGSFGTASDDGTFALTNVASLTAVTPDGQAISVGTNSSRTVTFTLQNRGTTTASYSLSCLNGGNVTCGTVSPSQVTVGPNMAGPVNVTFTTSAVGAGTITLHAVGSQGGSDDGTYNITNTPPPPTYGVSVTPDGYSTNVRFSSPQSMNFMVQNTGSVADSLTLMCSAGGKETCIPSDGIVSPGKIWLTAGATTPVLVNFSSGADSMGTVILRVTGKGGEVDQGSYNLTNVSPPPEQCVALARVSTPDYGAEPDVLDRLGPEVAPICPAVTVVPLTGSISVSGSTGGYIALFVITDTSGAPSRTFDLSCTPTTPVTCGSLSAPSISLGGGGSTTIAVPYSVGLSGTGSLKLTAQNDNSPQITTTGTMTVTAVPPTFSVVVTPDGQARSVDIQSAQTAAFQVQSTGTGTEAYTLTCVATGNETCGAISPSSIMGSAAVVVSYVAGAQGTGTVMLRAVGASGAHDSGSYNVKNTYFVSVTPDGISRTRLASRSYTDSFVVRNPGLNQTTYNLTSTCSGSAVSACVASPASVTLASGDSANGTMSYTTGAASTTGQVKLFATAALDATARDSGWTNVSVGTAQAPTVDAASVNAGATRERALCLTSNAGAGAATECGDLRTVHPLPATRTLNKLRMPTLLYNSAEARPFPVVAANVTLPATAAVPDTVIATLKIGSVTYGVAKWSGTDWAPGGVRRIVVADTTGSLATGIYAYTLTVTNQWNGVSSLTSPAVTVQVPVVNRQAAAFGAGWWLTGVERLYPRADSMLWVGGDGGTRQYLKTPTTNVWAAPNVDRPDTLKFDGTRYTRYLPHGLRVVFDAQGHHVFTIDRLSDTTKFTWGASDTLLTITMPPAGLSYQFTYTNGSRWLATAPATPGRARVDTGTITSGRLTAIGGPDNTRIGFGYGSGADANLIVSRTDRRGNVTGFTYDGGKRIVQLSVADIGTSRWQPFETLGYPTSDAPHATDTALAHARYEGPRTDVWDTTAFWLDRLGAPRKIINALGYQTLITRDNTWPALASQVTGPTGFVTQATYDSHGNILTATQVNPYGDGNNAVTTYTWDMTWDFVTSSTLAKGEISQFAYDPTNGNRLWQQPGPDAFRKVQFFYTNDAFHQLRAVQYPTSPVTSDSIFYDPTYRNVDTTKTPLGFVTAYFKDAIGRDTLTKTLDVATISARTVYDVSGQDTLDVTTPSDNSGTLMVRKHYDAEGNQDSLQTISNPDPAAIGPMQHVFAYDAANRKTSERLLGPTSTFYFAYDASSNLVNGGRQGGNNVVVTYDALNRPIVRAQLYGDTALFTYDASGMRTANNPYARISRTYYSNGALHTDTLRLATDFVPAQDFTQHIYGQEFRYDLDGRRVWAKHPSQLSPGNDTVTYAYDPIFGQLKALTDVVGNRYAFVFDSLGRPRRITRYPVGLDSVYETVAYDADGRLGTRALQTGTTSLLSEGLTYFGGGSKVQSAAHTYVNDLASTDQFTYTGFGGLTSAAVPVGPEDYTVDALGNRVHADHGQNVQPDNYTYEAASGFLSFREEIRHPDGRSTGKDTTFYQEEGDGRLISTENRHYWSSTFSSPSGVARHFTLSLYDPELRLIQTTYTADSEDALGAPPYAHYVSAENYRYDALGRRVYVREVRGTGCRLHDAASGCKSLLTRTVWDGSQALYEIQVPGDTGASLLESDAPPSDSVHGVVGYLHAGGIDQPLALWKSGEPVLFPIADYRGSFIIGTCPTATCNQAYFPQGLFTSFGDPPAYHYGPPFWHGSLTQGSMDASGYQYKRNRYYDPSSGRFTQEDPIGLAGGLNLYGFAGGDPVNFTDPFGLCSKADNWTNCKSWTAADTRTVFTQLGRMAPAINREVAAFVPKNILAAAAGLAVGEVAGAIASRLSSQTVVHFTSAEGAAAIEESGALRANSFVTTPEAVAGRTAGEVENLLELQPGRGAMNATLRVPADALKVPVSGPLTSGGAPQFQLTQPIPIDPGTFVPTPQ